MPDGRAHLGDDVRGSFLLFDLLYADDLVIICESEEALEEAVMRLEQATQDAGLTISVKKTKYLITKGDGNEKPDIDLRIRGDNVERVSELIYLGSSVNVDSACNREVDRRLALGAWRFSELRKPIWNQDCISLRTKMQIYRSMVLSVVLYGAESWTCTDQDYAKLNTFHNKNLRSLLGMKKRDIGNEELYRLTGSCPLEAYVRKHRLRWAGHVRRMNADRIPKRILFGELADGKRGKGRPKKNWMACLEEDWDRLRIKKKDLVQPFSKWTEVAKQRPVWQDLISYLTPR